MIFLEDKSKVVVANKMSEMDCELITFVIKSMLKTLGEQEERLEEISRCVCEMQNEIEKLKSDLSPEESTEDDIHRV